MLRIWRPLFLSVLLGFLCSAVAADDFIRGDSNSDGEVNISDAQYTLRWLFLAGSEPDCLAAADTNDDESVDISDAINTLDYLFLGGFQPAPPFPVAGADPTPGLSCGAPVTLELSCDVRGPMVYLSWTLEGEVDGIEVRRDGALVTNLDAGSRGYRDAPLAGVAHEYRVIAFLGGARVAPMANPINLISSTSYLKI